MSKGSLAGAEEGVRVEVRLDQDGGQNVAAGGGVQIGFLRGGVIAECQTCARQGAGKRTQLPFVDIHAAEHGRDRRSGTTCVGSLRGHCLRGMESGG